MSCRDDVGDGRDDDDSVMLLQVCYVKRLYVYTTLSDVILERLLSQLGGVDLLWLGDSMSRCEVTCDGNTMTSLPGVGRLVSRLYHISHTPFIPRSTYSRRHISACNI